MNYANVRCLVIMKKFLDLRDEDSGDVFKNGSQQYSTMGFVSLSRAPNAKTFVDYQDLELAYENMKKAMNKTKPTSAITILGLLPIYDYQATLLTLIQIAVYM